MMTIAPLLFEAENYLVQYDLDRAAALYQKALELDPDSPLPHIGIARIALAAGRFADGRDLLDAVLLKHPQSVEALTIRGVAAEAARDVGLAMDFFTRAVALSPTYGPAAYNLGRILAQQSRWPEACVHLRRASELMPHVPEIAIASGTAAFRAGALADAAEILSRCIETSPYSIGGYVTLADVLVEAGKLDLADALMASAEGRFTRQAIFPSKRAAIAMRRGDTNAALGHARRQVALAPSIDEGWLLIAVLELSKLNVDAAEAAVHEVLRRNPKSWRAHYQLGGIYETLRLFELAEHAYRNAVALAPKEWQPKNNLATLLLERHSVQATSEARALLTAAVALAPQADQFMPEFNLALACLKLGDRLASARHARAAAGSVPKSHALAATTAEFLKNFE